MQFGKEKDNVISKRNASDATCCISGISQTTFGRWSYHTRATLKDLSFGR